MTDASYPLIVTVLSWNIEGLKNHIYYLKDKLVDDCVDIAFLSEPQIFQYDQYDSMTNSHANGGTMVLWKKWLDPFPRKKGIPNNLFEKQMILFSYVR